MDRRNVALDHVREQQIQQPLFEFSGACAGCGETPYIKLLTQLFGDRLIVANATGCSSIYGGNLPTTPWTQNAEGRGPAWSNSLFEDNAEFGMGFRVSLDKQRDFALELAARLAGSGRRTIWRRPFTSADQKDEAGIYDQRERVAALKRRLESLNSPRSAPPAGSCRYARAQECLDRWRRRLGLRHRLRRPRSRPCQRRECEGPAARHGSVLEYRRAMLQSDAARPPSRNSRPEGSALRKRTSV